MTNPIHSAFIGIGSNLQSPLAQVKSAVRAMQAVAEIDVVNVSPWYGNPPIGPAGQPDYVNGVAQLSTTLSPIALLDALQAIENSHGRERTERWGARTLDLDILLYDALILNAPRLIIPHKEMHNRVFVLRPLEDIAPGAQLPDGRQVSDLLAELSHHPLEQLA